MFVEEGTQQLGEHLDAMGIEATFEEGEMIIDAVVVMRVFNPEGSYVKVAWHDGTDFVVRRGMLECALDLEKTDSSSED